MSVYSKRILPRLIDFACRQSPTTYQRKKVVPGASGDVLELGIGSGLNLPYYNPGIVRSVTGLDPSVETWDLRKKEIDTPGFTVLFEQGKAEAMPFEDSQFDTVLVTYTLCSIGPIGEALDEVHRVLRPGGRLIFSEHGLAPDRGVRRIQRGIEPVWKIFSGGCVLSRDIPSLITESGFEIEQLDELYVPGWRPASYTYWGEATVR